MTALPRAASGLALLSLLTVPTGCSTETFLGRQSDERKPNAREDGEEPEDTAADDPKPDEPENRPPVVTNLTISPDAIYADGSATCTASFYDPDGDQPTATYYWTNNTRGRDLGQGPEVQLSPSQIRPGELLGCRVVVEDPEGLRAEDSAEVSPSCGFSDPASLSSVDMDLRIIFRPWVTDELIPGHGGEPWDWDGSIPSWIWTVADALSTVLGWVNSVYPTPETLTAEEALDIAEVVLDLIDEYGPELLASSVPPDPDLYPYMVDWEGYIHTFYSGTAGMRWDDTYQVEVPFTNLDFLNYGAVGVDMEDIDLWFDDNMGDWLDHGDWPLLITSQMVLDTAWCTSIFYNPTEWGQFTDLAWIPSSILWMQLTVE